MHMTQINSQNSLQFRLLTSLMAVTVITWLVVLGLTWRETDHELNELLDAHLAQTASFLVAQTGDGHEHEEDFTIAPTLHKYQPRVAFQIWHENELMFRSDKAPAMPFATDLKNGFSDRVVDGQVWRIFSTQGKENDIWVHVAELGKYREDILYASLESAILPLMFVFPLLALLIWWSIHGALRPLKSLGNEIGLRKASSLTPLDEYGAVNEVQPLVRALNQLFRRVEGQMLNERQFTADAAHELRTPIAAIRMQAQVALGASHPEEKKIALENLMQGCDRATRLISQMLALSRLEADSARYVEGSQEMIDVVSGTRQQLAESAHEWLSRKQTLNFDAPDTLMLSVKPEWLSVLVRNLVENASRYSPNGATIQVTWQELPSPRLTVEDSGPGLSDAAMSRLGDRFFRVLGQQAQGSGLGWSIVKRIANLSGIKVHVLHSPLLGGLRVELHWPSAT